MIEKTMIKVNWAKFGKGDLQLAASLMANPGPLQKWTVYLYLFELEYLLQIEGIFGFICDIPQLNFQAKTNQ
ncbi:MAG: hypothetical protein IPJ71_18310 [Bdellovibrionales bacterium]|nr:hypothetical protein [Bdellovibrionales bacterium]